MVCTSWRPCWRYNTKEYVINSVVGSSRHSIGSILDCKPRIHLTIIELASSMVCPTGVLCGWRHCSLNYLNRIHIKEQRMRHMTYKTNHNERLYVSRVRDVSPFSTRRICSRDAKRKQESGNVIG